MGTVPPTATPRLDPTLKPARETRLRVVEENLTIRLDRFGGDLVFWKNDTPLAEVKAAYVVENPTAQRVQVDYGFPILNGHSGRVDVTVEGELTDDVVTNEISIYGVICQNARTAIQKGVAADKELARLFVAVGRARGSAVAAEQPAGRTAETAATEKRARKLADLFTAERPALKRSTAELDRARGQLQSYLVERRNWNRRDAALMLALASLDLDAVKAATRDRGSKSPAPPEPKPFDMANGLYEIDFGVRSAIGDQKTTQFFAQLGARFDKEASPSYEALFAAWGGDVRQRAVDLRTGAIRLREFDVKTAGAKGSAGGDDSTVFARVDYFDPAAKLGEFDKAVCQDVLKNLPVTFSFAPMSLVHYQITFPPKSSRVVTVSYLQYAFADTAGGGSYQIAYVLHPATFWNDFGPIQVTVLAPKGVACKASVPLRLTGEVTTRDSAFGDKLFALITPRSRLAPPR